MLKPIIPLINWNNPMTKGLIFDAAFFEKGGTTPMDIVGRLVGTLVGSLWKNDLFGTVMSFAGGSATDRVTYTIANLPTLITVECLFNVTAIDATARRINGITTNGVQIIVNTAGITFQQIASITNGSWAITFNSTGTWQHLLITYDSSLTSNNPSFYLNGVLQTIATTTNPVGSILRNPGTFWIGNSATVNRCFNGSIAYYRYWNRLFNAQDAKQMYTNPWNIDTTISS